MKKFSIITLFALLFTANGCKKQDAFSPGSQQFIAPDPSSLDEFIRSSLESEGAFLWATATEDQVWTALSNSDYVLSIGYKPAGESDILSRIHTIDIKSSDWVSARNSVLNLVLAQERIAQPGLSEKDIIAFQENGTIPVLNLYVKNPVTISLLRRSNQVRYAEPIGYEPYMTVRSGERSGSGCDFNTAQTDLVEGEDYFVIAPDCKQSWNHSFHKITEAWNNSTGEGCKIAIVDTGVSAGQENLGADFNQGFSSGRNIGAFVTIPGQTSTNDECGHGTSMLGASLAPRGIDGAATGIAYNTDASSYRAAFDVYLNQSNEVTGVANAFTSAGNDNSVRIISMSMGRLTSASQITDAIVFAHNKGKMIFCAAGTSFWWTSWFAGVIFPATLSQAIAVTGLKDNLSSRCGNCHSGGKVDFVLVMEKSSTGRHPISLADTGDDPSTVGGSSVATASTAGIAALVWAKYPSWTRQQVFDRLKTSSNYFPNRHGQFGWGRINAQLATQ